MGFRVRIVEGPIVVGDACERPEGAGSVLTFDGVVRPMEDGEPIGGLEYEAYEPMASRMLERIGSDVSERHGLHMLDVVHSTGYVPVGGTSLRVTVASAHRAESIRGMEAFIDLLKRDVPIWKRAVVPDAR